MGVDIFGGARRESPRAAAGGVRSRSEDWRSKRGVALLTGEGPDAALGARAAAGVQERLFWRV